MRLAILSRAEKIFAIWLKPLDKCSSRCYNKTIKKGLAAGE